MLAIFGIILVFAMVFGGFISAGGKIEVILHALPHELVIIGGATIGAFLIGNKGVVAKGVLKDLSRCFKGATWNKNDYKDLLSLLFILTKTMKSKGLLALESHLEKPHESPIFSAFPRIIHDHAALDLICDTLRMMTMSLEDPHQIEDAIQRQLEKHHHEVLAPGEALQNVADALPAIGIVAAVLGVIKTMSSIDQPPAVLGHMIGGALVGTFMGVFMAYCFVGPIANKIKGTHDQDAHYYRIIRDVLVAHLKGNAPQVSIEIGRGNIPTIYQPSFAELEATLNDLKV
ncbi:MAG: flagellar motor stator protein MotA [Proteobacteria bacterium]|nr:flagellar motor stator protein MotA [Pseudomonadota bacterium]